MKNNNRNLRDTVKYINSLAIAKGILQPVKCVFCPKVFRQKKYLDSHIGRKHQDLQNSNADADQLGFSERPCASSTNQIECGEEINDNLFFQDITCDDFVIGDINTEQTVNIPNNKSDLRDRERVMQIEVQCNELNGKLQSMVVEFENQKSHWEEEKRKKDAEVEYILKEKNELKTRFEKELTDLKESLSKLAEDSTSKQMEGFKEVGKFSSSKEDYLEKPSQYQLRQNRAQELLDMRAKLIAEKLQLGSSTEDSADMYLRENSEHGHLSSISEASGENDVTEVSVDEINSLSSDSKYDEIGITKECTIENTTETFLSKKTTEPPSIASRIITESLSSAQVPTPKLQPVADKRTVLDTDLLDRKTTNLESTRTTTLGGGNDEVSSEFDNDQSTNNYSEYNVHRIPAYKNHSTLEQTRKFNVDKVVSFAGKETSSAAETDDLSDVQNWSDLIRHKNDVWMQLKVATEDVVREKLVSLGIMNEESRISELHYKQSIRQMKSTRKHLQKKYSTFKKIKKRILKELKIKADGIIQKEFKTLTIPICSKSYAPMTNDAPLNQLKDKKTTIRSSTTTTTTTNNNNFNGVPDSSSDEQISVCYRPGNEETDDECDSSHCENEIFDVTTEATPKNAIPVKRNISEQYAESQNTFSSKSLYIHDYVSDSTTQSDSEEETNNRTPKLDEMKHEKKSDMNYPNYRTSFMDKQLYEKETKEDEEREEDSDDEEEETNVLDYYTSQQSYEEQEYKPIKLKQPTGQNIIKLKAAIESKLQHRTAKKLAGAVNTLAESSSECEENPSETQVMAFQLSTSEDQSSN